MTTHNKFWDANTGYLGDFVETRDGRRGRIYKAHYECPESVAWLRGQELLGPDPKQYEEDRWVSILVHGGGAITVPDSFVTVIEPFELVNNNSGMYFPLTPEQYADRPSAEPQGVKTTARKLVPGRRAHVWGVLDPEHSDSRTFSGVVAEHGKANAGYRTYAVLFTDGRTVYTVPHAISYEEKP